MTPKQKLAKLLKATMAGKSAWRSEDLLVAWAIYSSTSNPGRLWRLRRAATQIATCSEAIDRTRTEILSRQQRSVHDSFDPTQDAWVAYVCEERPSVGIGRLVLVEVISPYAPDDPGLIIGTTPISGSFVDSSASFIQMDLTDMFGEWYPMLE